MFFGLEGNSLIQKFRAKPRGVAFSHNHALRGHLMKFGHLSASLRRLKVGSLMAISFSKDYWGWAVIMLTCLSIHETKADIFEEMRCIERAGKSGVDACSQAISSDPDNANLFLHRAQKFMSLKDYDRAIGDFTAFIEMNPGGAGGVYAQRGEAWQKLGELDKAIADFKATLARLRTNTERISEVRELLARAENEKKQAGTKSASPSGVRVKLIHEGGVYTVPVTLNDVLALNFVLDSGASEVSIPSDVVTTLIRTGTIKETDFTGSAKYRLADGSTVVSRTFIIRSLKVGDQEIEQRERQCCS